MTNTDDIQLTNKNNAKTNCVKKFKNNTQTSTKTNIFLYKK